MVAVRLVQDQPGGKPERPLGAGGGLNDPPFGHHRWLSVSAICGVVGGVLCVPCGAVPATIRGEWIVRPQRKDHQITGLAGQQRQQLGLGRVDRDPALAAPVGPQPGGPVGDVLAPRLDDQLCFDLVRAARAVTDAYRTPLGRLGLTHTQYLVLLALWQDGTEAVHSDRLAVRLDMDPADLAPAVMRMVCTGLLDVPAVGGLAAHQPGEQGLGLVGAAGEHELVGPPVAQARGLRRLGLLAREPDPGPPAGAPPPSTAPDWQDFLHPDDFEAVFAEWQQRFAAIVMLALLGGGIVAWLIVSVVWDGRLSAVDGGALAAAFLSLREVFSKIEKIALGIRTPEPVTELGRWDHKTWLAHFDALGLGGLTRNLAAHCQLMDIIIIKIY